VPELYGFRFLSAFFYNKETSAMLQLFLQSISTEATAQEQHQAAHQLLEQVLQQQGVPIPYTLQKGKYGKPFLPQSPDLHFNLSHCKGAVLCGTASLPIGVDAEPVTRPCKERVIRRVCTETEQQAIRQADNPNLQFIRFWTLKESFVKAIGIGISYPMQQISFSQQQPNPPIFPATCSIQVDGKPASLPLFEWVATENGQAVTAYRFFQGIWAEQILFSVCVATQKTK
jgi:4'-phosphopantetheinyl transferase